MARLRLTAKGIEALATKSPQADFWDDLTRGLCLRVSGVTGLKTWLVRYRANGKHRRQKIGTYPAMSLADARSEARSIMTRTIQGEDPALEREVARSTDHTFEAMAREVLDAKAATTRERTQHERERILKADLLPAWRKRPAGSVTRREVVRLVERIAARATVMGNRTLALIRLLYNEALAREFPGVEYNPAHMVRPPRPEGGRDRFLERDEIAVAWKAMEEELPIMRTIFRVTLLTAQRVGSVCAMRWEDIDGADVWRIPAEAFKGRRPHLVPLSTEVLDVIAELRGLDDTHVFPGRTDGKKPHVVTTSGALNRIRRRTELKHWTTHDFRTTFRTHATRSANPSSKKDPSGLGVAPNIADAVLGHIEPTLGFRRYTGDGERYLLAEKREALEKWGAFVIAAKECPG